MVSLMPSPTTPRPTAARSRPRRGRGAGPPPAAAATARPPPPDGRGRGDDDDDGVRASWTAGREMRQCYNVTLAAIQPVFHRRARRPAATATTLRRARARLQPRQIEAVHFSQQFHEAV